MTATLPEATTPTDKQADPRLLATPDRTELLALAGILLVGLVLRIYGLGAKSLWLDELVLARSAYGDGTLLSPFGFGAVVHPPGYLMLIRLVEQFVGRSDLLVRLPAALFSFGGILAIWALGRAFAGPAVGLTAAFILAISAFHIQYGQELHTYALFATLSAVLLWSLLRAVQRSVCAVKEDAGPTELTDSSHPFMRKWAAIWWPFVVTAVIALYSHYYAVFTVALTVFMMPTFLLMESGRPFGALWREKSLRAVLVGYVAAMMVVGVLFVPQAIFGLRNSMDYASFRVQSVATGELIRRFEIGPHLVTETFISFVTGRSSGIDESALLLILLVAFFLLGFLWMLAQPAGPSRRRYRFLALAVIIWIALPLPVIAWLSQRAGESFAARRLIFALPMIVIVESIGLVGLANMLGRWGVGGKAVIADLRSRPVWPVIILLLGITTLASIGTLRSYYLRPKQDYRAVAQLLQSHVGQQDVVAALGSLTRANLAWYYLDPITDLSRNVVSTLESLCAQNDAMFLVGVPPGDRYPENSASWIAQNFVEIEFYQISVYYRNCQADTWFGDGAEALFDSALRNDLSFPWISRSQERFAALADHQSLFPALEQTGGAASSGREAQAGVAADDVAPTSQDLELTEAQAGASDPPDASTDLGTFLVRMAEVAPDDSMAQVRLGAFALQQGASPDQAEFYFQRAIDLDPTNWLAYALWANSLIRAGQPDAALATLQSGRGANPDSAALAQIATRLQDASSDPPSDTYRQALENARQALADRRWGDAIQAAQQAVTTGEGSYEAQLALGDAYRGQNSAGEAVAAYSRAVEIAPSVSFLYGRLAEMLARMGRWEEAIDQALLAISIDQSRWENWYALGLAYSASLEAEGGARENESFTERVNLAEMALRKALELAPVPFSAPQRALDELRSQLSLPPSDATPAAAQESTD